MKISSLIRKGLVAAALAGMATISGGQQAQAATEQGTLDVSADVAASCIVTAGAINFGTYDPLTSHTAGNPLDGSGSFGVRCANGLGITIRLDDGQNGPRNMTDGTDMLDYDLFSDAPGGTVWGNTGPTGVVDSGTGANVSYTVHGRIPGGQNVQSGAYTDQVTVSVDF